MLYSFAILFSVEPYQIIIIDETIVFVSRNSCTNCCLTICFPYGGLIMLLHCIAKALDAKAFRTVSAGVGKAVADSELPSAPDGTLSSWMF